MTRNPLEGPSAVGRRHVLLGARARRLARPRREAAPEVSTPCLVCEVNGELYGLPLSRLARVAPFIAAARTPTRNPAMLGVLARSGVFYHVFDLGLLLGAGSAGEAGHVALLRGSAPAIALRVDRAKRVAALVELPPDATSQMGASHPAVKAFARPLEAGLFEGRMISLIDVDQLTSDAQRGRDEGELRVDQ